LGVPFIVGACLCCCDHGLIAEAVERERVAGYGWGVGEGEGEGEGREVLEHRESNKFVKGGNSTRRGIFRHVQTGNHVTRYTRSHSRKLDTPRVVV
jgi:hypothetical protein